MPIRQNFFVPVDAAFPIVGLPVPLSVVFRQTLTVTTMFTAQTGTLEATGEYDFGGVLLSYIDQAGAIGAIREVTHIGGVPPSVVTVAINRAGSPLS